MGLRVSLLAAALLTTTGCPGGDDEVNPDAGPDAAPAFCRDIIARGSPDPSDPPQIWRLGRGEPVLLAASDEAELALSPDATRLAVTRPFAVHILDLVSGGLTVVPVDGIPGALDWTAKSPTILLGGAPFAVDPVMGTATALGDYAARYGGVRAARLAADGHHVVVQTVDFHLVVVDTRDNSVRDVASNAVALLGAIDDFVAYERTDPAGARSVHRVGLDGVDAGPAFALPADSRDLVARNAWEIAYVEDVAGMDQVTVGGDLGRSMGQWNQVELLSWTGAGLVWAVSEPTRGLWFGDATLGETHAVAPGIWYAAVAVGECR